MSEFEKQVLEQLKDIQGNIKGLQSQVKENTAILKALEHSSKVNKAEIDKISVDVAKLTGSVEGIKSNMSTVEIVAAQNNLDIAKLKAVK